jgi:hypothetical protein
MIITCKFTAHMSGWNYLFNKMILLIIKIVWPEIRHADYYHSQIYCSQVQMELFT